MKKLMLLLIVLALGFAVEDVVALADVPGFNINDCANVKGAMDGGVAYTDALPAYAKGTADLEARFQDQCLRNGIDLSSSGATAPPAAPNPPNTQVSSCKMFLTFRAWYCGLTIDDEGTFREIGYDPGEISVEVFVWTIILNILSILFGLVGYLAIAFVIYGGYSYVLSRGDPSKIAKGKKTVVAAITGLIICILASLITSLVVDIITSSVE